MYVVIDGVTYTQIKNLSFNPQLDVVSDTVPVNELSVEIKTNNTINAGKNIKLYDDRNQLWANFWILYADVVEEGFVTIKAQSAIGFLERYNLPAKIYTETVTLVRALDEIFDAISGYASYTIDGELATVEIKGFMPEQTARERLQWLCFVGNAFVKQCFTNDIQIKALNFDALKTIPIEKTYWKPEIEYADYVTKIEATAYSYTEGTPQSGDETVKVGNKTYIQTETIVELRNPNVPATAAPNEIKLSGINLINTGNADRILSRLALLYFERKSVKADVVNNRDYQDGERVSVCLDKNKSAIGFIEQMNFTFGKQAKSTLDIFVTSIRELFALTIIYYVNNSGIVLQRKRYDFPVGYNYTIENEYIDLESNNYRNVYRPIEKYASGTIPEYATTNRQAMEIALIMAYKTNTLMIYSVSDIEFDTKDKVVEIG